MTSCRSASSGRLQVGKHLAPIDAAKSQPFPRPVRKISRPSLKLEERLLVADGLDDFPRSFEGDLGFLEVFFEGSTADLGEAHLDLSLESVDSCFERTESSPRPKIAVMVFLLDEFFNVIREFKVALLNRAREGRICSGTRDVRGELIDWGVNVCNGADEPTFQGRGLQQVAKVKPVDALDCVRVCKGRKWDLQQHRVMVGRDDDHSPGLSGKVDIFRDENVEDVEVVPMVVGDVSALAGGLYCEQILEREFQ
ncbi:hypothetical protein QAD02_015596 [Eretmocerus hayati]|uniref:Uncharacterized protein n=1 Tax=Eretmocerus hayati TaxID=131215 RepID=A0ACC2P870_9HYME|nr:hypothetical protein QAD02_015596 [Eretmocerus hayati]